MSRAALFGGLAAGAVAVIVAVAASDGWLRPDVAPQSDDDAGPAPSTDAPRPASASTDGLSATPTPGDAPPAPDGTPAPDAPDAAGGSPEAGRVATDPLVPPAPLTSAPEAPAVADGDPVAPTPDATAPDATDMALAPRGDADPPAPANVPDAPSGSAGDPAIPATGVAMPAFDLVRAESDGSALVAGSAEPGAGVEILIDGDVAARTDAAGDGRFVVFLDLPDGGQAHVLSLRQSAGDNVIVSLDEIIVAPRTAVASAPTQADEGDSQAGAQAPSGTGDSDAAPLAEGPTELALAEGEPQAESTGPSAPASRQSGTAATPEPAARAPGMPASPPADAGLPGRVEAVGAGPAAYRPDGGQAVGLPDASAPAAVPSLIRSGEVADPIVAAAPEPSVRGTIGQDPDATRDPETAQASAQPLERPAPFALSPGRVSGEEAAEEPGSDGSVIVGSEPGTEPAGNATVADAGSGDGAGDPRAQTPAPEQETAGQGTQTASVGAPAPAAADTPPRDTAGETPGATEIAADSSPGAESTAPRTPSAPVVTALPQTPSAAGPPVDMAAAPAPDPADPARPMVLRSTPQGVEVMPDAPLDPGQVALDQITYDDTGAVSIAGRGERGGMVRLYLDNAPVATARIAADGRWRTTLPEVDTGTYTLRADRIDEGGAVTARAESPFQRVDPNLLSAARADGAAVSVTVQPGNTLWGISRIRYGEGIDYVRIFDANRDQIRDPDLIYPGQIFDLPE